MGAERVGLPLTPEEAEEVEEIRAVAYMGGKHRVPERDVRWVLTLLAKLDQRLTPDCACECHGEHSNDHCDTCCQGPLCEDCRFYARSDA